MMSKDNIDSNKSFKAYLQREYHLAKKDNQIEPNSKYFGEIGSTDLEDIPYDTQLNIKLHTLKKLFQDESGDLLSRFDITRSAEKIEYRFKMEFVCSFDPFHEPNSRFGQRKKGRFNWVVDMDECNLIPNGWFQKVRRVYRYIQDQSLRNYDLVKKDGFLRYLTIKQQGDEAMLIITTTDTDSIKDEIAEEALNLGFKSVYWVVNSTVQDTSEGVIKKYWGEEYIYPKIRSGDHHYSFKVAPNTFFQNNIGVFEKIIAYIREDLNEIKDLENYELNDLYCGVGTIAIALADLFSTIKGLELVEESIALAKANAILNNIEHIAFEVMDISNSTKSFEVSSRQRILIVDPPRTGLGKAGITNVLQLDAERIYYISCNPVTQKQDLDLLKERYEVLELRAFDMFPHTLHVENVAILRKRM